MLSLLDDEHGNQLWANKISSILRKKTLQVEYYEDQITAMYGGMGSLNDIILQDKNGYMPKESNDRFSNLRTQLFQLVK